MGLLTKAKQHAVLNGTKITLLKNTRTINQNSSILQGFHIKKHHRTSHYRVYYCHLVVF